MSDGWLLLGERTRLAVRHVAIGLSWDPHGQDSEEEHDLDVSACLLDQHRKLPTASFFVYYSNAQSPDGSVRSSGDERTGGKADGDVERLIIELERVDPRVQEIVVTVTLHEADVRRRRFGQVRNALVRAYDADDQTNVLWQYDLTGDFAPETALEFVRLHRQHTSWRLDAVGSGHAGGLRALVSQYI